MRSRATLLLLSAACLVADLLVGLVPRSSAPRRADVDALAAQAVAVDFSAPFTPETYRFLNRAVRESSIVQLGESIHVTAEFPRARLWVLHRSHRRYHHRCARELGLARDSPRAIRAANLQASVAPGRARRVSYSSVEGFGTSVSYQGLPRRSPLARATITASPATVATVSQPTSAGAT